MEPERPIEKLLRVFAKKRRDQAGAPLEMPTPTRRLLQNEVARRGAKESESNVFLLLLGFLRRPAFALCLLFAVAIGAWLMFNLTGSQSKSMRMAQGTSSPATADKAAEALPANAPEPQPAMPREESKRLAGGEGALRKETANRDVAVNNVKQERPAATPPLSEPSGTLSEMDVTSRSRSNLGYPAAVAGNVNELLRVTNGIGPAAPSFGESGATNFGTVVASAFERRSDVATVNAPLPDGSSVRYRQIPNVTTGLEETLRRQKLEAFSASLAVSNSMLLFADFEVQRNGSEIRIIDGDGSVYGGVVVLAGETSTGTLAIAASQDRDLKDKKSDEVAAGYFFRVSGTNQSLKRNIVFTGSFLPVTNSTGGGMGGGGGGGPAAKSQLSNPIIRGTVSVDDATKTEIQAVPTP